MASAGMTGPDGPVPLRAGALRALLRQPDLPPDLVAKISARADHLARAEQREARARGWVVPWSRLPIIVAILMTLVVAAGIAFTLLPAPPEAGFTLPSMTEDAPVQDGAAPDVDVPPRAVDVGTQPVAGADNATSATGAGKGEVGPAASAAHGTSGSGSANHAPARTNGLQATGIAGPASAAAPSKEVAASGHQTVGKADASRSTVAPVPASTPPAGPSVGAITPSAIAREAVPPVTIEIPAAVPVIDPPAL